MDVLIGLIYILKKINWTLKADIYGIHFCQIHKSDDT